MPLWKQALFSRLQNPNPGDDGSGGGGGGGGDDAAAIEAARIAAEAAKNPAAIAAAEEAERARIAAGGKPRPTDTEAALLKEVMQKKDALLAASTELATAKARIKEFDGIDPVAVRALLADKATAETAALEAAGNWASLKERMSTEHTASTQALKDTVAALQAQLNKSQGAVDELSIGGNFSQSSFIADELVLTSSKARVIYGAHFDLVDGAVVGYDKPRGAEKRTALVDEHGDNQTFDVALRKIVDADPDKDHMLKSKIKPGASSSSKPNAELKKQTPAADSLSKIAAGMSSLKLGA